MAKPLHLIYVPGLGDTKVTGQQKAVNTWRWWGVEAELFQMKWADGEAWEHKFGRLLQRIDELAAEGKDIGIVGASAGGSAVVNAYAARKDKMTGVVCIAGKVNRPHAIGGSYRRKHPAFVSSAYDATSALENLSNDDRKHILSRYALIDEVVYKSDSRIPGAVNRVVPSIGHFLTIAIQITFGAPGFIRFLKRQQNHKN